MPAPTDRIKLRATPFHCAGYRCAGHLLCHCVCFTCYRGRAAVAQAVRDCANCRAGEPLPRAGGGRSQW
jgi:hypothetical protein